MQSFHPTASRWERTDVLHHTKFESPPTAHRRQDQRSGSGTGTADKLNHKQNAVRSQKSCQLPITWCSHGKFNLPEHERHTRITTDLINFLLLPSLRKKRTDMHKTPKSERMEPTYAINNLAIGGAETFMKEQFYRLTKSSTQY